MKPRKTATGQRLSLEHRTQLENLAGEEGCDLLEVLGDLPAGLVSRAMAGEELSALGHARMIAALDLVRAEGKAEVPR